VPIRGVVASKVSELVIWGTIGRSGATTMSKKTRSYKQQKDSEYLREAVLATVRSLEARGLAEITIRDGKLCVRLTEAGARYRDARHVRDERDGKMPK
jgi:hypothetical protein